jgi:hypothetical protein
MIVGCRRTDTYANYTASTAGKVILDRSLINPVYRPWKPPTR